MGDRAGRDLNRKVKVFSVRKFAILACVLLLSCCSRLSTAQAHPAVPVKGTLQVDASAPAPPIRLAEYDGGTNRTPVGRVLGVMDRYLTLDGKPWIPVMGEMHYGRVPEADWDADLARMKAAGVDVVSTYIIWIYHEEVQGQWDWSGRRDLRRFAQLCQKHGLLLMVRIGPWAHAETRNGGLPDWVMRAGPTRRMDPKFMAETGDLYDQIAAQLRGLLWKDGGPIAGVQIENEYARRGPGEGAPYILALKAMARKAGLDVPIYTVTGWDHAVMPPREFLPVFGGYPAAPWSGTIAGLPPQEVYAFRFRSRVSGNMGMIGAKTAPGGEEAPAAATPFLTAEMGGGIEDTYHRRPVVSADDIAAMVPVMLGSGVNGYGTYMMVGGEDPTGKLSTLEESQATGYPTDVPVKSYDFQAPIGEFGQERRSLRLLKEWNYFMQDFGSLLAPMPSFAPVDRPVSPADPSVLRWSVRTDGRSGFVFVNNYVRGAAMPARRNVQFTVSLPEGRTAQIPAQPVDVPSGAFFAWPFGLPLGGGVELQYATAQLMAHLLPKAGTEASSGTTDVLFCLRGIRCELSLRGQGLAVQAPAGVRVVRSANGALLIREADAADLSTITVRGTDPSAAMQLVLLSPEAAENTWKLPFADGQRLVRTRADIWADGDGLSLAQLGDPVFHFAAYPPLAAPPSASVPVLPEPGGFRAALPPVQVAATLRQERAAATAPPVPLGPALPWRPVGVAQAPGDAVWTAAAAVWRVRLAPEQIPSGVSNVFLRLRYAGDEARLMGPDAVLLEDNFWNGQPWLVGLRRFAGPDGALSDLHLQVLPIRADAPVYLPTEARTALPPQGQLLELKGVEAIPEYQLRLRAPAGEGGTRASGSAQHKTNQSARRSSATPPTTGLPSWRQQ